MIAAGLGVDLQTMMGVLIVIAAAGFLTAYVLVCVAAPVFTRLIGEPHPWTTVLSWSGAVLTAAALGTFSVVQVRTAHGAAIWTFVLLLVLGPAFGWRRLSLSPVARGRVGLYDEATSRDVLGGDA